MVTFSEVIPHVTAGGLAARSGWNGKGMFIFMRPMDVLPADFIYKVKSLPDAAKTFLAGQERDIKFTAYLCMYAADGSVVNGWLASQTDLLADDWQLL